jgi:hypothetical protein
MAVNLSDYLFPVGSIYITLSDKSPVSILGGTWTEIEGGRFLMSGAKNGTIYKVSSHTSEPTAVTLDGTVGTTGGYNLNGMIVKASSYHGVRVGSDKSFSVTNSAGIQAGTTVVNENVGQKEDDANVSINTTTTGTKTEFPVQLYSTVTFNNYPPYFTVHMWRRTA